MRWMVPSCQGRIISSGTAVKILTMTMSTKYRDTEGMVWTGREGEDKMWGGEEVGKT